MKKNKLKSGIKKYILLFVIIIFFTYILLNIFVSFCRIKVDSSIIEKQTDISLSLDQMHLSNFVIFDNKNIYFKKLPLFMDINKNKLASLTAEIYLRENFSYWNKLKGPKKKFLIFTTKRYIEWHFNYKKCYNYIFSRGYFSNGIYGAINASKNYFSKDFSSLTEMEFIKMCLQLRDSSYYNILSNSARCDLVSEDMYCAYNESLDY